MKFQEDEHHRMEHRPVFFSGKQFLGVVGFVLATQVGINFFALKALIREEIKEHNADKSAHPETLIRLTEQRAQMMETIGRMDAKLDGIEKMLSSIAQNGGFNVPPGNGRR